MLIKKMLWLGLRDRVCHILLSFWVLSSDWFVVKIISTTFLSIFPTLFYFVIFRGLKMANCPNFDQNIIIVGVMLRNAYRKLHKICNVSSPTKSRWWLHWKLFWMDRLEFATNVYNFNNDSIWKRREAEGGA